MDECSTDDLSSFELYSLFSIKVRTVFCCQVDVVRATVAQKVLVGSYCALGAHSRMGAI